MRYSHEVMKYLHSVQCSVGTYLVLLCVFEMGRCYTAIVHINTSAGL